MRRRGSNSERAVSHRLLAIISALITAQDFARHYEVLQKKKESKKMKYKCE